MLTRYETIKMFVTKMFLQIRATRLQFLSFSGCSDPKSPDALNLISDVATHRKHPKTIKLRRSFRKED